MCCFVEKKFVRSFDFLDIQIHKSQTIFGANATCKNRIKSIKF